MNRTHIARMLRKQDGWAERLMWKWLRDRRFAGYKFRREHPFGPYFLDFFCLEAWLNIELDGIQHTSEEHRIRDQERDAYLEARGIKVLRFHNPTLRKHKITICDQIWSALQQRAPHPETAAEDTPRETGVTRSLPPHPGPLPRGEGGLRAARPGIERAHAGQPGNDSPSPKGEARGEGEEGTPTHRAASNQGVLVSQTTRA